MFRNYLKVTIRNFVNQKYYSIINTLGLALGLAACIIILLYVQDELSYESPYINHDKIYRLVQDFPMGDHLSQSATVPFPTKNTLATDFPEVKNTALVYRPSSWSSLGFGNQTMIRRENEEYYEDDFIFAEHNLLKVYDFDFIKGDPGSALKEPNELVISTSIAKKYFGDEDPMGQTLRLNRNRDLKIVGVINDLPHNTHLKFNMIASFETFKSFFPNQAFFETQWVWVAAWLYFTVDDPKDVQRIQRELPKFTASHYPAALVEKGVALKIQKANDIHLNSNLELEFKANGKKQHVYIFSSIAILILILAIINFMNLATARSAKRSKEVGLRKVMGARREMLITQFMGEAIMTTFLALVVAVFIIYNLLPWFNNFTGKSFDIHFFRNPFLITGIGLLLVLVGFISGSYPSLILSSFKPTEVLKGKIIKSNSGGNILRQSLVVVQFVVSITLMICIGIVYKQLNYVQTMDLGFNKDQIMFTDINFNQVNQYNSFKNNLEANSSIAATTLLGGSIPGEEALIENAFLPAGAPEEDQQWFSLFNASYDFEKIFNIEFLQGHSFKQGSSEDTDGFIINEAAAKSLGWPLDDVVGRQLTRLTGNNSATGTVIGLVKDFHYRPVYDPIKPLVIARAQGGAKMCIKLAGQNVKETLAFIENEWKANFDGVPFRYSFLDKNFEQMYAKEESLRKSIQYFSFLAIFIACLGLLGLSSFSIENRKKEIGIRKVNGATTVELVGLLIKDFTKLVFIAFIISVPASYYFGNLWLNDFAYKTKIGLDVFVISGAVALGIAILTVSYHTVRAALRNPVNSLRYE